MTTIPFSPEINLTDRHYDVLELVADGMNNDEIAKVLDVGVETIKTHVKALLRRTGAASRPQLIALAYRMSAAVSPVAKATRPPRWSEQEQIAKLIYAAMLPEVAASTPWESLSGRSRERCRSAALIAVLTRNDQLRGTAR